MCKKTNYATCNTHIDKCMKPLIKFLKEQDYETVACCCGHEKYPMTVVVKFMQNGVPKFFELLTNTDIDRIRRFYKKDKEGYFYIPEVSNGV